MIPTIALQPALHSLVSCISAPSVTLSDRDGGIGGHGAEGFFLGERRLLSSYALTVLGRSVEVVHSMLGADGVLRITAIGRDGSEDNPDPTVVLRHSRRQHPSGFTDTITIHNVGARPREVPVTLTLASDFASTSVIKAGLHSPARHVPHPLATGIGFDDQGYFVNVTATPHPLVSVASSALSWSPVIERGEAWETTISVIGAQPDDDAFRPLPPKRITWDAPTVRTDHQGLATLADWSFGDLRRLALADPAAPNDVFIAAGSPWFLTLFGRDSLWAARMMMPFSTSLAASTLRALARRQGVGIDVRSAEQPGRILHEVRPATLNHGILSLPPIYYGTVDATPLWITTLAEAWRWGLPDAEIVPLLGALRAAVSWLTDDSDADGDGLCEYIDTVGNGLSNQGWKDSGDSINWHDGTLAKAPIALVEVQGYAYEAAVNALALFEHFGLAGSQRVTAFAERLRTAFHDKFWIKDDRGTRLAIALDADKRAVDSTTSNPGHVLGTGLLSVDEEAAVVERLVTALDCGVGLRTLSMTDKRYNPLSYHNGSIWPHDTAICARGMILAGHPGPAGHLLAGLIEAATAFDGRLPELFASIDEYARIVPYPASCRPQAWSAALGAVVLWAAAPLLPRGPGQAPRQLAGIGLFDPLVIDGFEFRGQSVSARVLDGTTSFSGLDSALGSDSSRTP